MDRLEIQRKLRSLDTNLDPYIWYDPTTIKAIQVAAVDLGDEGFLTYAKCLSPVYKGWEKAKGVVFNTEDEARAFSRIAAQSAINNTSFKSRLYITLDNIHDLMMLAVDNNDRDRFDELCSIKERLLLNDTGYHLEETVSLPYTEVEREAMAELGDPHRESPFIRSVNKLMDSDAWKYGTTLPQKKLKTSPKRPSKDIDNTEGERK